MRKRITLTMKVLAAFAMAFAFPSTVSAHTITTMDCKQAVIRADLPTQAQRTALMQRCMDYRARHNTCHGVPNCGRWLRVAICESGNQRVSLTAKNIASIRWSYSGLHEGGMQFASGTWDSLRTGYQEAGHAPPEVQMRGAETWRSRIGGDPHSSAGWPNCGRHW